MGLVITWKLCQVMSEHIFKGKSQFNLNRIQEVQVKRDVTQVSQTDRLALHLGIRVDLMPEWDS
ncbi:uncharacterized protein G2W53_014506 [Senna tora]|uniref:Uncharacterized protein n=1 Tax=Senna tora TaxID=362788 RepID=A0A834WTN4_9FABA|nr:uncharacterized protein G2W53_014506 [Senna tora]